MPSRIPAKRIAGVVAAAAWLAAVVAGFRSVHRDEGTPGPAVLAPTRWPADSGLHPSPGRPGVLMAVHPRCPCTVASLMALAKVLETSTRPPSVRLLIYRPGGSDPSWSAAGARRAALAVPGVELVDDPGGVEAARLGLETSGAVVAFDAAGRQRFAGGLTAGRGVEELSAGGEALGSLVSGRAHSSATREAFGCPLVATGRRPAVGAPP